MTNNELDFQSLTPDMRLITKLREHALLMIDDQLMQWFEDGTLIDSKYDESLDDEELDSYVIDRADKWLALVLDGLDFSSKEEVK